jgi:hypothetical protein
MPDPGALALLRGDVAREVAKIYPKFAETVFGVAKESA